jgi:hypothetical protein
MPPVTGEEMRSHLAHGEGAPAQRAGFNSAIFAPSIMIVHIRS